jgi:colanic acid biosynthesis glycosyl transferase WcaI
MRPIRAVFICQYYPPEQAPIGVMIRELAGDMVKNGHQVTVVTGFPNHPAGIIFPGYSRRLVSVSWDGGVKLIRCFLHISPRKTIFGRLLNFASFGITSFLAVLFLEKPDLMLVVSPPLSNGLTAMMLKGLKGCRYIFNVQDIYPDAAVSGGVVKHRGLIGLLTKLEMAIYQRSHKVTVISEGFKENLILKGIDPAKIDIIYNWIDASEIGPQPRENDFSLKQGLAGKFVVLYSGTIGVISGAEIIIECALRLNHHPDILFLLVGEGVVKERIRKAASQKGLNNIQFLPFQPREILSEVLSSADITMVTLGKNKGKSSVPSKILGYMAAAKPVLASLDLDSDTARLIDRAQCGICVSAEDADSLSAAISSMYDDPVRIGKLGQNGREYLLKYCERKSATAQYRKLMEECVNRKT